ncbi:unnamed protein product [Protopolystoma xenopodis]|uniref:Uncharacterized protein n=1 Tax=Protopolystoma xenopodis TaxID=117903 RepID=A0A3S5BAF9_9PLAT|nr:unnamed protein product [Protopolystoma xenopodis]
MAVTLQQIAVHQLPFLHPSDLPSQPYHRVVEDEADAVNLNISLISDTLNTDLYQGIDNYPPVELGCTIVGAPGNNVDICTMSLHTTRFFSSFGRFETVSLARLVLSPSLPPLHEGMSEDKVRSASASPGNTKGLQIGTVWPTCGDSPIDWPIPTSDTGWSSRSSGATGRGDDTRSGGEQFNADLSFLFCVDKVAN